MSYRNHKDMAIFESRIPVMIVADNSESMRYIRSAFNAELRRMIREIKKIEARSCTIDFTGVHYSNRGDYEIRGSGRLELIQEEVMDITDPRGTADSGTALLQTLRELKSQRKYRQDVCKYHTPVILLLTDGPNSAGKNASDAEKQNTAENYLQACEELTTLQREGAIRFAAVGISHIRQYRAKKEELQKFTADPSQVFFIEETFRGLDLSPAISWLTAAIRSVVWESRMSVHLDEYRHIESLWNGPEESRSANTRQAPASAEPEAPQRTRVHAVPPARHQHGSSGIPQPSAPPEPNPQMDEFIRSFFHFQK